MYSLQMFWYTCSCIWKVKDEVYFVWIVQVADELFNCSLYLQVYEIPSAFFNVCWTV
jgi:hypothetical protein